jgi:hypothetical protein
MNETMLIILFCVIDDFNKALMNTTDGQKMIKLWEAK